MLWATTVALVAAAAVIVLLSVGDDGDRGLTVFFLGMAWLPLLMSALRVRWAVAVASLVEFILAAAWAVFVYFSAMPCAPWGNGPLIPTRDCPVQTTHTVSVLLGGGSCLALFVGVWSGFAYWSTAQPRARRRFQIAFVLGAALVLFWLGPILILPRRPGVD